LEVRALAEQLLKRPTGSFRKLEICFVSGTESKIDWDLNRTPEHGSLWNFWEQVGIGFALLSQVAAKDVQFTCESLSEGMRQQDFIYKLHDRCLIGVSAAELHPQITSVRGRSRTKNGPAGHSAATQAAQTHCTEHPCDDYEEGG
jgi:hypothetical protein